MTDIVVTLRDGRSVPCIVKGSGAPLLLIHGAESDRTQFADLMTRLPSGVQAVAYDQRDTGDQVSADAHYTMDAMADDAAEVIEALQWSAAHVLGTSYGGVIAQLLAIRHPERVKTLSLVSTTGAYSWLSGFAENSKRMSAAARAQTMLDAAVSPESRAADPTLVDRIRAALVDRTAQQHARRINALKDHDSRQQLLRIGAPTLVVHGADDPVIPVAAGRELAGHIAGSAFWEIPKARHATAFEYGDELSEKVAALIAAQ
jgi:3-oxoadipate enol-lactonase